MFISILYWLACFGQVRRSNLGLEADNVSFEFSASDLILFGERSQEGSKNIEDSSDTTSYESWFVSWVLIRVRVAAVVVVVAAVGGVAHVGVITIGVITIGVVTIGVVIRAAVVRVAVVRAVAIPTVRIGRVWVIIGAIRIARIWWSRSGAGASGATGSSGIRGSTS